MSTSGVFMLICLRQTAAASLIIYWLTYISRFPASARLCTWGMCGLAGYLVPVYGVLSFSSTCHPKKSSDGQLGTYSFFPFLLLMIKLEPLQGHAFRSDPGSALSHLPPS